MENKETQKGFIKASIIVTASKIMAFTLAFMAFYLDAFKDTDGRMLTYIVPFIIILITGKQAIDWGKQTIDVKKEQINK